MDIQNFIVPIDFSKESLKGLELAILFSKKTYTNIQMVYVQKASSDIGTLNKELVKEYAEKAFKKIIVKYNPKLGNDSKLRYIIKTGTIYKEVVNQAASYKESMITASTHGASGFEEFFIGSNAYKIISATDRPVITIRNSECPKDLKKIVIPIDKSEDTRQKVPFTIDLAVLFGAEIHIIAINTSKDEKLVNRLKAYTSQVAGYINNRTAYVAEELFGDNPVDLVLNYSHEVGADLISIMTDQSSGLSLILGNITHQIISKSDIPILNYTNREIRKSGSFRTFGG